MSARKKSTPEDLLAERKQDHLDLCLREDVSAETKTTLLEEVELIHEALPDVSYDQLDTSRKWLGKQLKVPLIITGMTGGTRQAFAVNRDMAKVAEASGIAFGVGSQRAMQSRPDSKWTYEVRKYAPSTIVLANIGLGQACTMKVADYAPLIDALEADGLCLHLNVGQEMIQTEGDRDFRGGLQAFRRLHKGLKVPVIAKETGCGISRATAIRLKEAGIRNLDLSGAGGTSWIRIEALRENPEDRPGAVFREWGIPTAGSLVQVEGLGLKTIASGGIRTGLDVARAIALGATLAGVALPVYQAYRAGGVPGAMKFVESLVHELKIAMLLTGSKDLRALSKAQHIRGPRLQQWQSSTTARGKTRP
jgi:isopentenyl-diphosphate delta-isomerase